MTTPQNPHAPPIGSRVRLRHGLGTLEGEVVENLDGKSVVLVPPKTEGAEPDRFTRAWILLEVLPTPSITTVPPQES